MNVMLMTKRMKTMTKDEIREFVKTVIRENDVNVDPDTYIIDEIVNRWEEDVQENRDEAYVNGQNNMQEAMNG
jgi:hypothetical protein